MTNRSSGNSSNGKSSKGETATGRPDYVISRLRYFSGEFLATQDFIAEQDYHVDRQVRHQAQLHAPGVMEGLEVSKGADAVSVNVSFGSALDADGNQILLSNEKGNASGQRNVAFASNPPTDGEYIVYIEFCEDGDAPKNGENTRFTQEPGDMLHIGTSLPDGAVQLARVRVQNGEIDGVDHECFSSSEPTRKYAGLRLPGMSGDVGTVQIQNVQTNPDGVYPDDDDYTNANYKVSLSASGGLVVDGDGLWMPDTLTGSQGKVSIGKNYSGTPEDYLEVWNGSGTDANPLLVVTEGAIHAYSNTVIDADGKVSIGKDYKSGDLDNYLEVWNPDKTDSGDSPLMSVSDSRIDASVQLNANGGLVVSNTLIGTDGKVSVGNASIAPSNPLEVYDESQNQLLRVSDSDGLSVTGKASVSEELTAESTLNVTGLLTARGGLTVSNTQIDANGQMAIGKSSGSPSNPLEVYGESGNPLLTVSSGDGLTVTVETTVLGALAASEYTFPTSATPGDTPPTITARTVPTDQGGTDSTERTELILFASNDTTNKTYGPDAITLRAPALRMQTYSDPSVGTIDDAAGCNDRLYIDPNGKVSIGKSYYPDNASNWLEVWNPSKTGSGDSALLEVHDDKINTSVPLNANAGLTVGSDGLTLNGASSLFGDYVSIDDFGGQTASSDGFVIMLMSGDKNEDNWYGDLNVETKAPESNEWKVVAYCSVDWNVGDGTNVRVPMQSTMALVRKGYSWKVQWSTNYSGNDSKNNKDVEIEGWWVPLGNS